MGDTYVHIGEILARNARRFPNDVALVERTPAEKKRVETTWKQFDDQANQFANVLTAKGVKRGDKVIHFMMNSLDWLVAYFGIIRTGAWVVPLNFRFTAEDVKYCCDVAEPTVVVYDEEFAKRIEAIKDQLPTVKHYICVGQNIPAYAESFRKLVDAAKATPLDVEITFADPCGLYFTSGTTGQPKPILLTHKNMVCACITENAHHWQGKKDVFILIPPLYHTGAKMHWFGSFIVGAKSVLLKGVSPEWTLEAVSEEGGTIVWLLVPWAQDILLKIDSGELKLSNYKLDQWRLMHIGAQPVPPALIQHWKKYFPKMQYDTNYGLSESTGPGCVHLGIGNEHKIGSIGRPGFNWETRIVDENGKDVKKGDPGELLVRGDGVMREYYRNPEATAKTLVNGWLYTGDMAREDEDGFIWLVDRKKDVIITGGENVFPVEVEDYLHTNPNVKDIAAIGLPDERLGEIVAVIVDVVPGKTLTEEEVLKFCEGLPKYKRPRKIFFGEVPRNPTGKIEKPKLRKLYSGREEAFKI
ncbi:MAG TPA: AMP-binding protein [Syntrophorhabdaceae bacterium]|nr:AMP-binding protein [Syntrophorhabdaceae bacterium]HQM81868.1 AMP-binding protein [Syntrophorhabdaceae bacterium]